MIQVRFVCRNCGYQFVAKIFEKGEAEEKRVPTSSVRCPQCKSTAVERN
jgi:transposase-like protein